MRHDNVKSAARVFAVLEYFAVHRQPARLRDLSGGLGLPASSMTAILRTMFSSATSRSTIRATATSHPHA
ncbi:helix-turn-helix domain-containing protein [Sulfitobacter dubius]|uniref:helix-turn-helix domain-containing protein n=1 Tax=Sulfitobacter dubius TaxID=218673 RepID=UPI003B8A8F77